MPSSTTPPVAFSLSAPLAQVAKDTRRRPVSTVGPVAALLLPLLPLAAGTQLVLGNGGSGALQGFLAGAPAGKPGALILRPDVHGWMLLAALFALLTAIVAVIVAAGLATGATASGPSGASRPTLRVALARALAVWPAMFLAIAAQLLAVAVAAAVIIVVASYAGHLRFQLTSVMILFGLGTLVIWLIRGSLWPATAIADDLAPVAALRRSWEITHGSVMRLFGAALVAALTVFVPALIVRLLIKLALTALAGQEIIGLSPLAIDLWALLPIPCATLLASTLWGREAPLLHDALVEQQRLELAAESLDAA